MKCVVTGGGGFLGRSIVKQLLAEGYQVKSLGRSPQPIWDNTVVEAVCCDITQLDQVITHLEDAECVFHTAAIAGVWGKAKTYHDINILGTRNILKACLSLGVQRLIFTSSPSVVFDGLSHLNADEHHPYPVRWFNDYQRTKAKAEQLVLAANSDELQTISLRPHLIIGPDDPHLIPRLVEKAQSGQLKIVGNGKNLVDMVHVENAASSHLNAEKALRQGRGAGEAFFITNGEPVELWTWTVDFLKAIGATPPTRTVPFGVAFLVGGLLEKVYRWMGKSEEPPMTRFVAKQLATHHTYSIKKARDVLGYDPKVSMEQATLELVELWREKLKA
jgi:nucleoside-diphosphate-sugar epimerase